MMRLREPVFGACVCDSTDRFKKGPEYVVEIVPRQCITAFIEEWHYSKNINGCNSTYCFALYDRGTMIGACFYGSMAMSGQWKKFGESKNDVTELRRFCCADDAPRNTESYFIGATLRWLRKNTCVKTVVSYADPEYGHYGTIYRASNFQLVGQDKTKRKVIVWGDKIYHEKVTRAMYKGKLKNIAIRLRTALAVGEAEYRYIEGKICYRFNLR